MKEDLNLVLGDALRAGLSSLRDEAAQEASSPKASIPIAWLPMGTAPRRNEEHILLLTSIHGVVEAWFSPGYWSENQEGREYTGSVWVCGDDVFQIEVEEEPEGYHDGEAIGWLPRSVLAQGIVTGTAETATQAPGAPTARVEPGPATQDAPATSVLLDRIETLERALRHAQEAILWYGADDFELDGVKVSDRIDAAFTPDSPS